MMEILTAWGQAWGATDVPVLPRPELMQIYRLVGWGLVLACVGAALVGRWGVQAGRVLALALFAWVAMPGAYSPDYWLGLAFQAPSAVTTLLSVLLLARMLWGDANRPQALPGAAWVLAVSGVVLGYVLMLDTFAVLPWQVYRQGFGPAMLVVAMAFSLLLWVLSARLQGASSVLALVPLALLLFAALRLPSGNAWDALLDPLLWLYLHGLLIRAGYRRLRGH